MKIIKNSRQMPKNKEQASDRMYSDVVYGWLQVNSVRGGDDNVRWISRKDVKFAEIADCLGISRQTASTKLKRLLESGSGLVVFNEEKDRYELPTLDANMAMLIENKTLRKMISALNENSINVYIYLLNRYLENGGQSFEFDIEQVKIFIGLGRKTRSNSYIIEDILFVLQKLGLVKIMRVVGSRGKVNYKVEWMKNYIEGEENY